jgi:hypothetical protein
LVAAKRAITFWDEGGIFVISGAEEVVAPRVNLFAEIGAAKGAVKLATSELDDWVARLADAGSVEPLVLAAGFSSEASRALTRLAVERGDHQLLHGAWRAVTDSGQVQRADIDSLVVKLAEDARQGGREGWKSWMLLLDLRDDQIERKVLEDALVVFPRSHQQVGQALLDLRFKSANEVAAKPQSVLDVFSLIRLDHLPKREPSDGPDFESLIFDVSLARAIEEGASALLGLEPTVLELVVSYLDNGSMGLRERLMDLLRERGFGEHVIAATIAEASKWEGRLPSFLQVDYRGALMNLLNRLCTGPHASLTTRQRRRLDELANLLETLNLNNAGAWLWSAKQEAGFPVVDLFVVLGGFDRRVVAAQAQVVLDRLARCSDDHEPFYALFDTAEVKELMHWDAVEDRVAAVDLLLEMLTWGFGSALSAARALMGAPVADICSEKLRALIPRLARSPRHEYLAAIVLCSIVNGPEPSVWCRHADPILRRVAARICQAATDGPASAEIMALVNDSDGHVRAAAVRRFAEVEGSGRDEILRKVAEQGDPAWTCLGCRTDNEAGRSSCKECHVVGPTPAKDARAMLEGKSLERLSEF